MENVKQMKKLYVGNLSYDDTEDDLHELFSQYGTVVSINVITDRDSGRPKGFAFVEYEDESSASGAIEALDGSDFMGRPLRVNIAQPKREGGGGGGGGYRGGGRGGRDQRGGGGRW